MKTSLPRLVFTASSEKAFRRLRIDSDAMGDGQPTDFSSSQRSGMLGAVVRCDGTHEPRPGRGINETHAQCELCSTTCNLQDTGNSSEATGHCAYCHKIPTCTEHGDPSSSENLQRCATRRSICIDDTSTRVPPRQFDTQGDEKSQLIFRPPRYRDSHLPELVCPPSSRIEDVTDNSVHLTTVTPANIECVRMSQVGFRLRPQQIDGVTQTPTISFSVPSSLNNLGTGNVGSVRLSRVDCHTVIQQPQPTTERRLDSELPSYDEVSGNARDPRSKGPPPRYEELFGLSRSGMAAKSGRPRPTGIRLKPASTKVLLEVRQRRERTKRWCFGRCNDTECCILIIANGAFILLFILAAVFSK